MIALIAQVFRSFRIFRQKQSFCILSSHDCLCLIYTCWVAQSLRINSFLKKRQQDWTKIININSKFMFIFGTHTRLPHGTTSSFNFSKVIEYDLSFLTIQTTHHIRSHHLRHLIQTQVCVASTSLFAPCPRPSWCHNWWRHFNWFWQRTPIKLGEPAEVARNDGPPCFGWYYRFTGYERMSYVIISVQLNILNHTDNIHTYIKQPKDPKWSTEYRFWKSASESLQNVRTSRHGNACGPCAMPGTHFHQSKAFLGRKLMMGQIGKHVLWTLSGLFNIFLVSWTACKPFWSTSTSWKQPYISIRISRQLWVAFGSPLPHCPLYCPRLTPFAIGWWGFYRLVWATVMLEKLKLKEVRWMNYD